MKKGTFDCGSDFRYFCCSDFVLAERGVFCNLFKVLRLWKTCEKGWVKVCGKGVEVFTQLTWKSEFFTIWWKNLHMLWENVESFTTGFTHRFNRGGIRVLHIFHRAYYNYY